MTNSNKDAGAWEDDDSALFIADGDVFVPDRAQQFDVFRSLVPAPANGLVVELCCGAGHLAQALLAAHPDLTYLALDGSPAMLAETERRCGEHAARITTCRFEILDRIWREFDDAPVAVFSSLAVHHLDGAGKRQLFKDMTAALQPGGRLVIADLVKTADAGGNEVAARAWDDSARRQSLARDGNLAAFERFVATGWNYYRDPQPDPIDKPDTLLDQLGWMQDAGLAAVDVYWLQAGHAIFGGFKPGGQLARAGDCGN
jgi:tRNA (cmo5U34)-methyltransferase